MASGSIGSAGVVGSRNPVIDRPTELIAQRLQRGEEPALALQQTVGVPDNQLIGKSLRAGAQDKGERFRRMAGITQMHAFGFGRAAPGSNEPALYMVGTVEGRYGIHRSTDGARQWVRINDDAHQWGLILQITGDPKTFGRVYVGTHGRGVLYGDPAP